MAQQRNTISSSPRSLRSLRLLIYSTTVENVRQIGPVFFKTKPILRRGKIQISSVVTMNYQNGLAFGGPASKAKQSQFEPKSMSEWVSFSGLKELGPAMCSTGQPAGRHGIRGTHYARHGRQRILLTQLELCSRILVSGICRPLGRRSIGKFIMQGM